jgi:hypothetical protein
MSTTFTRRPTLFEQINNISTTANNDYVVELMAERNCFGPNALLLLHSHRR